MKRYSLAWLQEQVRQGRMEWEREHYVYFRKEAVKHKLHQADFEKEITRLLGAGYTQMGKTTLRSSFRGKTFTLAMDGHKMSMCWKEGRKYHYAFTNYKDDRKNDDAENPFPSFSKAFRERTGKTLKEAFGATDMSMKICVPQPLYYKSPQYADYAWIDGVCKSDFSSHYPSQAILPMPNAGDRLECEGTVKPNERYPFAFYVKSGHMAILDEFDTHDCKGMRAFEAAMDESRTYRPHYDIDPDEDITVLMGRADETMEREIRDVYLKKANAVKGSEEYKRHKLLLLKFIGMFQQNNPKQYASHPFAHIAATTIWRANMKMLRTLKEIGFCNVIQVCVDGVIYRGKPVGSAEKSLGSLVLEYSGARFISRGLNQYIIQGGGKEDRAHAGLDANIDKGIMEWEATPRKQFKKYMMDRYHFDIIRTKEFDNEQETQNQL